MSECPVCGDPRALVRSWDNGSCLETGYRDAGEVLDCPQCGQLMSEEVALILGAMDDEPCRKKLRRIAARA